jgi:hypothetical protein
MTPAPIRCRNHERVCPAAPKYNYLFERNDGPDCQQRRVFLNGDVPQNVGDRWSRDRTCDPKLCAATRNLGTFQHDTPENVLEGQGRAYLTTQPLEAWRQEQTDIEPEYIRNNRDLRASLLMAALESSSASQARKSLLQPQDREGLRPFMQSFPDVAEHGLDLEAFKRLAGNEGVSEWARRLPTAGFGSKVALSQMQDKQDGRGDPKRLLEDLSFPLIRFFETLSQEDLSFPSSISGTPVFDLHTSKDTPLARLSFVLDNDEGPSSITLNWIVPAMECPRFLLTRGDVDSHGQTHHTFALSAFGYETANVFPDWGGWQWGNYGHHAPVLGAGELTLTRVFQENGIWHTVNTIKETGLLTESTPHFRRVAEPMASAPSAVIRIGMHEGEDSFYVISDINNKSGHYRPSGDEMFNMLPHLLRAEFGVNVDQLFGAATVSVSSTAFNNHGKGNPNVVGAWAVYGWEEAKLYTARLNGVVNKSLEVVPRTHDEQFRFRSMPDTCDFEGPLAPQPLFEGLEERQISVALVHYHHNEQAMRAGNNGRDGHRVQLNGKVMHGSLDRTAGLTEVLYGGSARVFLRATDFERYVHADTVTRFYRGAAQELEGMYGEAVEEASTLLGRFEGLDGLKRALGMRIALPVGFSMFEQRLMGEVAMPGAGARANLFAVDDEDSRDELRFPRWGSEIPPWRLPEPQCEQSEEARREIPSWRLPEPQCEQSEGDRLPKIPEWRKASSSMAAWGLPAAASSAASAPAPAPPVGGHQSWAFPLPVEGHQAWPAPQADVSQLFGQLPLPLSWLPEPEQKLPGFMSPRSP